MLCGLLHADDDEKPFFVNYMTSLTVRDIPHALDTSTGIQSQDGGYPGERFRPSRANSIFIHFKTTKTRAKTLFFNQVMSISR